MRAGWANIYIGLMSSERINWWRVNGLMFAVGISVAAWVLLALAYCSS
jgi:hypothetical protein